MNERENLFLNFRNFCFPSNPNHFITLAVPAHTEGRFAIVTNVGQGMRWMRAALLTKRRLVDGEVVWS